MTRIQERSGPIVPAPVPPSTPVAPGAPISPPLVFVQSAWEYKHLVRLPAEQPAAEEAELTRLGADGWELLSAFYDGRMVHLYLKRQVR